MRYLWRKCESGCLCLSARWCLVSSAHSQPCLLFIANILYSRRNGHIWYNKDKERERVSARWTGHDIECEWIITVGDRYNILRRKYDTFVLNYVFFIIRLYNDVTTLYSSMFERRRKKKKKQILYDHRRIEVFLFSSSSFSSSTYV